VASSSLGGIFGDRAPPHPAGIYPPWVLEEVPRRWGNDAIGGLGRWAPPWSAGTRLPTLGLGAFELEDETFLSLAFVLLINASGSST
jgi:hypothetical protein